MSTQELVTSIVAEQEESTDQFLSIIQQKIEDAIEVKRIELASQMFAESKGECPECEKAKGDCECEDEEEDDDEEDDMEDDEDEKEMKEEAEQMDEKLERDGPVRQSFDKFQFTIPRSDAAQKYSEKKVKERDAMNKANDPGADKKGYALSVLDRDKAIIKGYKKGVKNPVTQAVVGRKGFKEEAELNELSKDKLVSYVKSAMKNKKPTEKRLQGISTASRRLASMDEMAPPGAKYERMVKHIKKGYAKGGLTKKEKSIAYATAWKAKNKEMSEAAMSDAQQMSALGMKGADKAKTMMALSAYRKHGDINKLSAGHRSLLAGYMEKTGGLAAVNRGTAAQALKKERMQEE